VIWPVHGPGAGRAGRSPVEPVRQAGERSGGGAAEGRRLAIDPDAIPVDRLMHILEIFRELDPDMPIQYALSFLTLARNPGLSIRDLADRLGVAQSSASRNVAALSAWHSFRKPGHDLVVAQEDPRERRRKVVTLTAKGEALLERIAAVLERGRDNGNQSVTRVGVTGQPGRQALAPAKAR